METNYFDINNPDPIDRVDGKAKVTGSAIFAADNKLQDKLFGFLVGSTISKGRITAIDTRNAERAPGVSGVITHLNAPKIPGYHTGKDPSKPQTGGQPLRIFYNDEIFYYDQPIALVIADTYERVLHAAKLVTATYQKADHLTDMEANVGKAKIPTGPRFEDYNKGQTDAYKNAAVKIEHEYYH